MNKTFKALGLKEWTVTDTCLIFKGVNIPFNELNNFNLVTTPTTSMTNGVIQTVHKGKLLALAFPYKQKNDAHEAVEFVKNKIEESHGVAKGYKYLLTSKTGTKLEVYNDYVILYFMPSGNLLSKYSQRRKCWRKTHQLQRHNFYSVYGASRNERWLYAILISRKHGQKRWCYGCNK